jgi:hypothetical protein
MAVGRVGDCVDMRILLYASGDEALSTAASERTERLHCERVPIHFERVEKYLEASALPADLQEQDTCHRYLHLSYPLSL